jgi:hypothetical protein
MPLSFSLCSAPSTEPPEPVPDEPPRSAMEAIVQHSKQLSTVAGGHDSEPRVEEAEAGEAMERPAVAPASPFRACAMSEISALKTSRVPWP